VVCRCFYFPISYSEKEFPLVVEIQLYNERCSRYRNRHVGDCDILGITVARRREPERKLVGKYRIPKYCRLELE